MPPPPPHRRACSRFGTRALLGLVLMGSGGCLSSKVATMIAKAPNQQHIPAIVRNRPYAARYDALYSSAWRVRVGPPAAEISVATLEPGDYHFRHELVPQSDGRGHSWVAARMDWKVPPVVPGTTAPKGTIILLHGYLATKEDMVHWGLRLAEAGYRVVLLDHRAQGRSTGDWISYGAFESHDLTQVLDDLQTRGLAGDKVGVLGVSYGASVALLWAARDARVGAVVALEPFSRGEAAPKEFGRATAPRLARLLSDRDFDRATARAAKLGGFDWHDADVAAAADHITAPVLLFHGEADTWLAPENSWRIHAQLKGPREIGIVTGDTHATLAIRLEPIAADILRWFDRWLAPRPPSGPPSG